MGCQVSGRVTIQWAYIYWEEKGIDGIYGVSSKGGVLGCVDCLDDRLDELHKNVRLAIEGGGSDL